MRILFFLLISFNVMAQVYVTPDGKPIHNLQSYLLEGGRITIIPFLPSHDVSFGGNNAISVNDDTIGVQREISKQDYRPQVDLAQLEIFRMNLSLVFIGNNHYSPDQIRERQDQAINARNVDSINQFLPQMWNQYQEIRQDQINQTERIHSINNQLNELMNRDLSASKKMALASLYQVKLSHKKYSGDFGKKHAAIKYKYDSVEERNLISDESYPFLDMGAKSFKEAERLQDLNQSADAENALELSNTFLDVALGATPFVGTFKDAWEAYTGKNLISGTQLTKLERGISLAGFGAGVLTAGMFGGVAKAAISPTSVKRFFVYAEKVIPTISRFKTSVQDTLLEAAGLKLKTYSGVLSHAKVASVLKTMPQGQSVQRVYEGTDPNKIALIGRSMNGGVNVVKNYFAENGIPCNTFNPTGAAAEEWFEHLGRLGEGERISYEVAQGLMIYKDNLKWIREKLADGFTIIDIGDPLGRNLTELSPFYEMEVREVFGIIR